MYDKDEITCTFRYLLYSLVSYFLENIYYQVLLFLQFRAAISTNEVKAVNIQRLLCAENPVLIHGQLFANSSSDFFCIVTQ